MLTFQKYYGETGGPQHGNQPLHWPGTPDGFPFRGPMAPDLKQRETEDIPLVSDFKSRMFEMWDPVQKAEFDEINDKFLIGWYRLLKRSEHWDDEHKHYRIWMEWCQIYGAPSAK